MLSFLPVFHSSSVTTFSTNEKSLSNFWAIFMLHFYWRHNRTCFLLQMERRPRGGGALVAPFREINSVSLDILRIFIVFLRHSNQILGQYILLYQTLFLQDLVLFIIYYFSIKNCIVWATDMSLNKPQTSWSHRASIIFNTLIFNWRTQR